MRGKSFAVVLVVVVIAGGCTSSSSGSSSDSEQQTMKIALEGPISGDQASTGQDMLNGAELAAEQANAAGGVMGMQIQIVPADDKADPDTGKAVAQQMVDDGVFAVIGPYNSSVGIENLKTYLDADVVTIHLTSNRATNGEGFTIQPKDFQTAPIEADAITDQFKAHTVAVIYDPQTYTAGIASQLRDLLEKRGVDVVMYEASKPGKKSYVDLVRHVQQLAPDLVYVQTYYPQGGLIAKELDQIGVQSTCFMGLANQDPAFVDVAGSGAARRCAFSGVPSPQQFPAAAQYVTDYQARFGAQPGTWGSFTYDSMKLLFDAVGRAGGWDAGTVNDALAQTNGYEGVTGTITIDPSTGNRVDVPVVILQVDADGSFVVDPKWAAATAFGS